MMWRWHDDKADLDHVSEYLIIFYDRSPVRVQVWWTQTKLSWVVPDFNPTFLAQPN
jgi:hypothetical protein